MPGKNGFELLEIIEDRVPEVIFTTAYDEYALKAFEYNALDYLMKPIDSSRLAEAIAKVEAEIKRSEKLSSDPNVQYLTENDQVFVKDGEKCWFVKLGKVRVYGKLR
jgi:two-component system LytT family response regulator